MLYTGLDYHRNFSYITSVNGKGEIIGQKKLPGNGDMVELLNDFEERIEAQLGRRRAGIGFLII